MIHTLKLKNIEEHPIIKAYEKFIKNNQISKNNKDFIEKQLKFWKENIYSYITTDQELNLRFKIEIIKNELRIYIEDPFCNYIDANKGIEIKNYDEIEDETYKNLIETFLNSNSKVPEVKLNYNPSSSVNYANTYTSNTTNQVWCGDIYVYQNTNYYNPNYYAYYCSDCANYVSQSVYAGGIPLDSTWYPYTSSWTYCPDLNTYMWSNYCYLTYYRPYAIPGSICMMDQNDNNNPDHTTLIVYNDGSILKYSAHTHDRKQYILPSSIQFPVWFLVFY
ncbi:MAG: amidase domain-containing protein [Caldisericia bacterium]|nr:amidase domain-containing protein [Caldisericia bacterium]